MVFTSKATPEAGILFFDDGALFTDDQAYVLVRV
jgi:hypothetical protein